MKLSKNWSEVTIRQYQALALLKQDDPIEYLVNVIAILARVPVEEVEALSLEQLKKFSAQTIFLNRLPDSEKIATKVRINGLHYKLNLGVQDLSFGQYIDQKTIAKLDHIENMHKFLAVRLIPMERKYFVVWREGAYKGIDHAQELQDNLTMDVAYPIFVFFLNVWQKLVPGIQDYLINKSRSQTEILRKQIELSKN